MNLTLHDLTWKSCLVYLDDIIVFSSTFEEHLVHLGEVIDHLQEANIHFKLSKCTFATDTVNYLGHVVSSTGVAPDPVKIEKMKNMAPPTNISEVRTFLGMTGYYRRFIPQYAGIAAHLTELLKKDVAFVWSSDC